MTHSQTFSEVTAAVPVQRRPPARSTVSIGFRAAWPAVALYAGLRLVGLVLAALFAADQGKGLWTMLGRYDAIWYADIASNGYDTAVPLKPDGSLGLTDLAFFPLYPGLTALLDPVLPGGARGAGILLSWLAGLGAAWALYAIGAHLRDRATGIVLAGLWAVIPHAIVQSMGYTETLFTGLTAWALYATLRRRWLTAGLLCLLAGLTRPTAAAVVLVVGLSALLAVIGRRDGWRPWLGGLLAPLGLLGYMAWVGYRLGRPDGYFHVQNDAWKMSYDAGSYTLKTTHGLLTKANPLAFYTVVLVLLVAVALLVILAFDRVPWQLTVYAAAIVAMSLFGDGYYNAKARLLIPAFPLLIPIAFALARARRHVAVTVLALLTVISAGYGVYLMMVWGYSP